MTDQPDLRKLAEDIAAATAPVIEELRETFTALVAACAPENVKRLAAAAEQWREDHPLVDPGQDCHCWCKVRGHANATCTRVAETVHLVHNDSVWLGTVEIPMCGGCAAAVDERTDIARLGASDA